jgi:spore coat protein CotH
MKLRYFFIFIYFNLCIIYAGQAQLKIFSQDSVHTFKVVLPVDSVQALYQTLNAQYYLCTAYYSNGSITDTIDSVGLRIRGNTSLQSAKKSYKLSIDKYIEDQEYKGLRKINLIGNHNDPTMVREKLFYECWQKAGLPPRRMSFVHFYINNTYMGLYTNAEEIDKQWLTRVFGNDSGNIYKCSWGADLAFKGTNEALYKNEINGQRVYDLQTNELADDYSFFVTLLQAMIKYLIIKII